MKQFKDALFRTILATLLSLVPWILFSSFPSISISVDIFAILSFSIPVFIAMYSYNILKIRIGDRKVGKLK